MMYYTAPQLNTIKHIDQCLQLFAMLQGRTYFSVQLPLYTLALSDVLLCCSGSIIISDVGRPAVQAS